MSWVLVISAVIVITVLAFFLVRRTQKGYCCGCGANPSDGQQTRLTCGSNCTWQSDPCSGGDESSCDPQCTNGETCIDGKCTQDGGDLTCKDYNCQSGSIKVNPAGIKCTSKCDDNTCCHSSTAKQCSELNPLPTCEGGTFIGDNWCDSDNGDECSDMCCQPTLMCHKDYNCTSDDWEKKSNASSITCPPTGCSDEVCCDKTCKYYKDNENDFCPSGQTIIQSNYTFTVDSDEAAKKNCCTDTSSFNSCATWQTNAGGVCPSLENVPSDRKNKQCSDQNDCIEQCCPRNQNSNPRCCSLPGASANNCETITTGSDNCFKQTKDSSNYNKGKTCYWNDVPEQNKGYVCGNLPTCNGQATNKFFSDRKDKSNLSKENKIKATQYKTCSDHDNEGSCNGKFHYQQTNPGKDKDSHYKYNTSVGIQCIWDDKNKKCVNKEYPSYPGQVMYCAPPGS